VKILLVKISHSFTRVLVTHKYCVFLEQVLLMSRLFQSVMNGILKHERYAVVTSVLLIFIIFLYCTSQVIFCFLRNRLRSINKMLLLQSRRNLF